MKIDGIWLHTRNGTSRLISLRVPIDFYNEIKAIKEYWEMATMTETVFELIDKGFSAFGKEDPKLREIVLGVPETPRPAPHGRKHLGELKPNVTNEDRRDYYEIMHRDYQYLTKEDFIADGIPEDVVLQFYKNLGE